MIAINGLSVKLTFEFFYEWNVFVKFDREFLVSFKMCLRTVWRKIIVPLPEKAAGLRPDSGKSDKTFRDILALELKGSKECEFCKAAEAIRTAFHFLNLKKLRGP